MNRSSFVKSGLAMRFLYTFSLTIYNWYKRRTRKKESLKVDGAKDLFDENIRSSTVTVFSVKHPKKTPIEVGMCLN